MRLIKMVRICTIFTSLFVPLLVSSINAQNDDPFSTESSDWPDFGSESSTFDAPPAEQKPSPEKKRATSTSNYQNSNRGSPAVKPSTTTPVTSGSSIPASSGFLHFIRKPSSTGSSSQHRRPHHPPPRPATRQKALQLPVRQLRASTKYQIDLCIFKQSIKSCRSSKNPGLPSGVCTLYHRK